MSQCLKYPCRCLKSIRRYLKCRLLYSAGVLKGVRVRVLTRMPTAYYLSLVWYDVYYIRNLLSSYKNNHRLQKVLLSEVLTSITYTNSYIRSADIYQAGVLIRACACADQHACPSQNQSSAADLKKILINIESLTVILGFMCQRTSWKKQITLFRVPVLYSNTFFDIRKREVLCSMNSE